MAKRKMKAKRPATRGKAARKAPRKARKVEAIPSRYGPVVPSLVVRGAAEALAFYAKVFGAKESGGRMQGPDGKVTHAEFKIGGHILMIADEAPEMGSRSPQALGGTGGSVLLYTKDTDAVFKRALEAGARSLMEPADQFWGDRYAKIVDPFGHEWQLATHREDLTRKQMMERMQAMMAANPPPGQA